jgi:hypothetical protein
LFELDKQILELREKMERLPRELQALEDRIDELQRELRQKQHKLSEQRSATDREELELKSLESKIEKLRGQLSTAKDNREYQAFLHEIDSCKADISVLEDEILDKMTGHDALTDDIADTQKRLKQAKAELESEKKRIEEDIAIAKDQIWKLEQERPQRVDGIGEETLERYERLLALRGTTTMVPVRNNTCHGCFTRLTPQQQVRVQGGREVVFCQSCQRALYMETAAEEVE